MKMKRISVVKSLYIHSLLFSAISHIGDSYTLSPESKVFAVARELPVYHDIEDDLPDYPVFTEQIPIPEITEHVNVTIKNESPTITTGSISIIGVSTSAIVHIGSTEHIDAQSRIKHLRQFLTPPSETSEPIN